VKVEWLFIMGMDVVLVLGFDTIDVGKSAYHHLSQNEIASDNACGC
jgi:hypothetical protein